VSAIGVAGLHVRLRDTEDDVGRADLVVGQPPQGAGPVSSAPRCRPLVGGCDRHDRHLQAPRCSSQSQAVRRKALTVS
jgi:hypothetical protein